MNTPKLPVATILFAILFSSASIAQSNNEKLKLEITNELNNWNAAANKADLKEFMSLYDTTASIFLIGSDKGEICRSKAEIEKWLGGLFKYNSFEWQMNQLDIDHNKNTAWVFMDGAMIVTNKKGQKMETAYRFTGILVKKHHQWKWRFFNGSIPRGE